MRSGGLVCGLEGIYEVRRADLMAQGAKIRPETAELRLRWPRGGDGWKDGRTDGRTDERKDGRTEGRTYGNSPLCPTGHQPFGAAAQKGAFLVNVVIVYCFSKNSEMTSAVKRIFRRPTQNLPIWVYRCVSAATFFLNNG